MRSSVFKYNNEFKSTARTLRKNQTSAELFLWKYLRNHHLGGYKFFRQFPIGTYILDFYCHEKALAIELDGFQHKTASHIKHDRYRSNYLKKQGIKVVRFWDNEVFQNIEGVLEEVLLNLEERTSPLSSPAKRGNNCY